MIFELKGETISSGYRNSEKRYDEVFQFCKKFNRPISVLDLGAAEGYFYILDYLKTFLVFLLL